MDMSFSNLFSSLIISLLGTAVLMYGKRTGDMLAFGIGGALCLYPYFVSNLWAIWLIAVVLMVPLVLNRRSA